MNIFKSNKYKAIKTYVDCIRFDSTAEANYYCHLKRMQSSGKLKILELQPKVYLTIAKILYKPDFHVYMFAENEEIYIDVKGFRTPVFALKLRLWKCYGPGTLHIVKGKKVTIVKTTHNKEKNHG